MNMNSFETDLQRALFSLPFLLGVILQISVLKSVGYDSEAFKVCIPVIAALPYTTAYINESKNGYIKFYMSRCSKLSYVSGKVFACAVSGGLIEITGCFIWAQYRRIDACIAHFDLTHLDRFSPDYKLLFASGVLWSLSGAVLAISTSNTYMAYGGPFVIYYLLVIIHERYFEKLFCLYPYEWFEMQHEWLFGENGVLILLSGLGVAMGCIYFAILTGKIMKGKHL